MKFSIITITHNRAHLISQTIESVLKQTYQNFELLIIDDDSTDNTENVVLKHQKNDRDKIQYIKTERLGTPSKLRNVGLRVAKGDIISILDSDDIWLGNKLEEMYAIFSKQNDVHFVMHNLQRFSDINKLKNPYYKYKNSFHRNIMKELIVCKVLAFPVFSMRISLLQDVGFFDEEIMEGQHDYYLRVATKYKVFYLNKPLTLMRRHDGNLTKNKDVIHCLDALKSYNKLYDNKKINLKQFNLATNFMNFKIAQFFSHTNDLENSNLYINKVLINSTILSKWYIRARLLKLSSKF